MFLLCHKDCVECVSCTAVTSSNIALRYWVKKSKESFGLFVDALSFSDLILFCLIGSWFCIVVVVADDVEFFLSVTALHWLIHLVHLLQDLCRNPFSVSSHMCRPLLLFPPPPPPPPGPVTWSPWQSVSNFLPKYHVHAVTLLPWQRASYLHSEHHVVQSQGSLDNVRPVYPQNIMSFYTIPLTKGFPFATRTSHDLEWNFTGIVMLS